MSTYKGHTFRRSSTTTDTRHGVRNVYEIEGDFAKAAAVRPFLTTIAACREYVNECMERQATRGQSYPAPGDEHGAA